MIILITVTSKADPSKTYSADNIAIDERANGLSLMVVRKPAACSQADVAFDNIVVDYSKFDENDIVDVDQPSYVNVAAVKYEERGLKSLHLTRIQRQYIPGRHLLYRAGTPITLI